MGSLEDDEIIKRGSQIIGAWHDILMAQQTDADVERLMQALLELSARQPEKDHEEKEVGKEVLTGTETAGVATDSRRLPLDYMELMKWA